MSAHRIKELACAVEDGAARPEEIRELARLTQALLEETDVAGRLTLPDWCDPGCLFQANNATVVACAHAGAAANEVVTQLARDNEWLRQQFQGQLELHGVPSRVVVDGILAAPGAPGRAGSDSDEASAAVPLLRRQVGAAGQAEARLRDADAGLGATLRAWGKYELGVDVAGQTVITSGPVGHMATMPVDAADPGAGELHPDAREFLTRPHLPGRPATPEEAAAFEQRQRERVVAASRVSAAIELTFGTEDRPTTPGGEASPYDGWGEEDGDVG
jgi:hypothetical protein